MRNRSRIGSAVLSVLAVFVVAAPAFAHVTVEVDNARPGATTAYTISVPNESDTADTIKIEVQLPDGLEVTDVQPGKRWEMTVDGGVLVIEGGTIKPGDRRGFDFTAVNPREAGTLTFPAIQTYSDGEEVRWVGEPDSEKPAGQVEISGQPVAAPTEAEPPPATEATETEAADPTAPPTPAASETTDAAPPTEPTTSPVTPVIAVVLAVVVAGVILALLRRRALRT